MGKRGSLEHLLSLLFTFCMMHDAWCIVPDAWCWKVPKFIKVKKVSKVTKVPRVPWKSPESLPSKLTSSPAINTATPSSFNTMDLLSSVSIFPLGERILISKWNRILASLGVKLILRWKKTSLTWISSSSSLKLLMVSLLQLSRLDANKCRLRPSAASPSSPPVRWTHPTNQTAGRRRKWKRSKTILQH